MSRRDNEFVSNRLQSIASRHFPRCKVHFPSVVKFAECVKCCYYLVAEKYCDKWNDVNGEKTFISHGQLHEHLTRMPHCNIHREEFSDALGWFNGSRLPYKICLDTLVNEHVIHRSGSYSNAKGKSFSKSYSIHNNFAFSALAHYLSADEFASPLDIRSAVCCGLPKILIKRRVREAKHLYANLGIINGISLILPKGWDELDEDGNFQFNSKLTIGTLVRDMVLFKEQKVFKEKYGRTYDWFTTCSSTFRQYLFIGDKHFHEIIDCPSGIIWMLAIVGFKNGKIDYAEVSSLVFHCLRGNFYTDISGQKKTPALKKVFMRLIHSTSDQYNHLQKEPLAKMIASNITRHYPGFWDYLQSLRQSSVHIGHDIHVATTNIERIIMRNIMDVLHSEGHIHLFRVHDAIWGIDDIPNPSEYLYGIVLNHLINSSAMLFPFNQIATLDTILHRFDPTLDAKEFESHVDERGRITHPLKMQIAHTY